MIIRLNQNNSRIIEIASSGNMCFFCLKNVAIYVCVCNDCLKKYNMTRLGNILKGRHKCGYRGLICGYCYREYIKENISYNELENRLFKQINLKT